MKRAAIIITDAASVHVGSLYERTHEVKSSPILLADLHVILSWCPADNAAAARVRALLPKEDEDA